MLAKISGFVFGGLHGTHHTESCAFQGFRICGKDCGCSERGFEAEYFQRYWHWYPRCHTDHPTIAKSDPPKCSSVEWTVLFLTSIIPTENNDRFEIKAAYCNVTDCRAEPQKRTGRDELNRPVAIEQPPITFPGILAEEYHRNEVDDVGRVNTQRRALVTSPEISLRPGDLVWAGNGSPYVIRTKSDLDTWKTEYLIERQEDI